MKLKFSLLFFLAGSLLYATDDGSFGHGFGRRVPEFDYNPKEAERLLGHHPQIKHLPEEDLTVVPSPTNRLTVYLHGLGGYGGTARDVKYYYKSERLPGDIVTFDFVDADYGMGFDITKSTLGQWSDMKVPIFVLNRLYEQGHREIGMNGHSRGAATAVNLVAALADRTHAYDARLAELGINSARKAALLDMLRRGHIVLEAPLVAVRSAISHKVSTLTPSSWAGKLIFGRKFAAASAWVIDKAAPVLLKKYCPDGEQAIKSAELWHGAGIPTIMHFQEEDEVLGNARDEEFFRKLSASNGAAYTHMHVGRDEGHSSSLQSFAAARNRFLREHGAAHKLLDDELK